jgi:hypothetical protein
MKIKYIASCVLSLFCLASFNACKKVPDGFLSEGVNYSSYPLDVDAGQFRTFDLNYDASTVPLKVTLVEVRDFNTKQVVDVLTKPQTVYVWDKEFDPVTDTSLEIINGKRKAEEVAPMIIQENGGQVLMTTATKYVPAGTYEIDIKVQNSRGEKIYKNAAVFNFKQPEVFRNDNAPYYLGVLKGKESVAWNPIETQTSDLTVMEIKKIAQSPNKVVLKFEDKNGKLLRPGIDVVNRPNGAGGFLQNLEWYAYNTQTTAGEFVYDYPLTPFPYKSRGNGYCNYYRIPADNIASIDSAGTVAKSQWHLHYRFCGQLQQEGHYEYIVRLRKVTMK